MILIHELQYIPFSPTILHTENQFPNMTYYKHIMNFDMADSVWLYCGKCKVLNHNKVQCV